MPVKQRTRPTKAEVSRAKKEGFIFGRMGANQQADQVDKMKFSHKRKAAKKKR